MEQSHKRILVCAYRDWALDVYESISATFKFDCEFYLAKNRNQFKDYAKHFPDFDLIFFIGWSWIIPKKFVENNTCICFHPSALPKYRGGSPIQNQIIDGVIRSSLTAFVMDDGVDTGPICGTASINLTGNLSDVLESISSASKTVFNQITTYYLAHGEIASVPQNEDHATHYPRRKPEQSEIKLEDFIDCTSTQLHNKIRSLQFPYPNAYIVCGDGKKLFIVLSEPEG